MQFIFGIFAIPRLRRLPSAISDKNPLRFCRQAIPQAVPTRCKRFKSHTRAVFIEHGFRIGIHCIKAIGLAAFIGIKDCIKERHVGRRQITAFKANLLASYFMPTNQIIIIKGNLHRRAIFNRGRRLIRSKNHHFSVSAHERKVFQVQRV